MMTNDYISRADALAVARYSKDPVEGIKNLPGVFGWIPVTERFPDKSGYYLYHADSPYRGLQGGIGVSYYQHKSKIWKKVYNPCVTHWMPLPAPPKEEANG